MNNTKALYTMLGWQGGTIHDIALMLELTPEQLIYAKHDQGKIGIDSEYMQGQFAFSTCSTEYVKEKLLPINKGNLEFWLGYMKASERAM